MTKRPVEPMPEEIRELLESHDLMDEYQRRPFYQRNDYLAWIGRAKRPETHSKRINQMLDELERGGVYMTMDHPASSRS